MACSGGIEWRDAELTCLQEELGISQVPAWSGSAIVIVPTGNIQWTIFSDNNDSHCVLSPKDKLNQCIIQPLFHPNMYCCPYNSGPISAEARIHIFKWSQWETDENQPPTLLLRVANYLCVATFKLTSVNWNFLPGFLIIYSQTLNNKKTGIHVKPRTIQALSAECHWEDSLTYEILQNANKRGNLESFGAHCKFSCELPQMYLLLTQMRHKFSSIDPNPIHFLWMKWKCKCVAESFTNWNLVTKPDISVKPGLWLKRTFPHWVPSFGSGFGW